MAPAKIFVTGATGYIGGDALYALNEAHPDWEYTCLARNSEKGAKVASRYPKVRLVYGDLSSAELIEEESKRADIVLHCASSDDEPSVKAMIAGLSAHTPDRPGYLISTSGTGILCYTDMDIKAFGEASDKVWDDLDGIADIRSIPDHALHRNVDKIVLKAGIESEAAKSGVLKTALVCPPTIFAKGRGTDNVRSFQIPVLAESFLKTGKGWYIGQGLTKWSCVHVADLSKLYLSLCEEALKGKGGKATWGPEGYYFAEQDEQLWSDVSKKLAEKAKKAGLMQNDQVVSLSAEEVQQKIHPYGPIIWGSNSRSRASRAKKLLGWKPTAPGIFDTLDEALQVEAGRLDMLARGHAEAAAGN